MLCSLDSLFYRSLNLHGHLKIRSCSAGRCLSGNKALLPLSLKCFLQPNRLSGSMTPPHPSRKVWRVHDQSDCSVTTLCTLVSFLHLRILLVLRRLLLSFRFRLALGHLIFSGNFGTIDRLLEEVKMNVAVVDLGPGAQVGEDGLCSVDEYHLVWMLANTGSAGESSIDERAEERVEFWLQVKIVACIDCCWHIVVK